jgi:hypothetical protein
MMQAERQLTLDGSYIGHHEVKQLPRNDGNIMRIREGSDILIMPVQGRRCIVPLGTLV